MGKGSSRRPEADKGAFDKEYDRIFGKPKRTREEPREDTERKEEQPEG